MSLLQNLLRVLLVLALVMKVATVGDLFASHYKVHSGHHDNLVANATSPQDKHNEHCALDAANTSSSHCGVSVHALMDSCGIYFHAVMGVEVVPFVDQAWSTLNLPPRLRPPMRLA